MQCVLREISVINTADYVEQTCDSGEYFFLIYLPLGYGKN